MGRRNKINEGEIPLISVIIPVYKVEKYVHKCLHCVINQTYKNLEIILVDDGSPDSSGQICDEYAKMDTRVRVIHQENFGQSSARNVGLNECIGDYIAFIDSDDYLDLNYFEILYEMLVKSKADLAICCCKLVYDNSSYPKKRGHTYIRTVDTEEALKLLLYQTSFDTEPWCKLYKAELFKDIRFPEGRIYEDLATIYKVFNKCNKIVFTEEMKYYYLQRTDNTVGCKFHKNKMDAIEFANDMCKFIEKNYPSCYKASICRLVSANFNIYFQIPIGNNEFKKYRTEIEANIRKYRGIVLTDNEARKKARIACFLSFLGFPLMRIMWQIGLKG